MNAFFCGSKDYCWTLLRLHLLELYLSHICLYHYHLVLLERLINSKWKCLSAIGSFLPNYVQLLLSHWRTDMYTYCMLIIHYVHIHIEHIDVTLYIYIYIYIYSYIKLYIYKVVCVHMHIQTSTYIQFRVYVWIFVREREKEKNKKLSGNCYDGKRLWQSFVSTLREPFAWGGWLTVVFA